MTSLESQKKLLPNSPGCYIFKNSTGEILYIGKAKVLKKRVSNYWQKKDQEIKTFELVKQIRSLEWIITRTEVEALILEAQLIRQHQPKYNIVLKENQPYVYLKITNEEYPRLVRTREIINDGAKYFGPYPSSKSQRYLLLTTARLFGLRTEKIISRSGRELYKLLNALKAKDVEKLSVKEYRHNIKLAELFLRGRKEAVAGELAEQMKQASQKQNYELAKFYHEQIKALKVFSEKQLISLPKNYDQDIFNYIIVAQELRLQIFNINRGVVASRQKFNLSLKGQNLIEVFFSFLQQYYLTRPIPKEVITPDQLTDESLLSRYLTELKGEKVIITHPQSGDKKELLELVRKNLLANLQTNPLAELQAVLSLPYFPQEIECFDISNTSGLEAVGSCVHFSNGEPNKNLYRKFKIKTVTGPNDFAMMCEVLARRYAHHEWAAPDLVVVDGGKGQLGAAQKALASLKISLPIIALAKKREEIYLPGQARPIVLPRPSAALKVLQHLRDEAHRFALTYHKKLRRQRI